MTQQPTLGTWKAQQGINQMVNDGTTMYFRDGWGVFSDAEAHGDAKADAHLLSAAKELLHVATLIHEACREQSNLASTATQEERDRFISRIYEISNDFAYPAITKAEGK